MSEIHSIGYLFTLPASEFSVYRCMLYCSYIPILIWTGVLAMVGSLLAMLDNYAGALEQVRQVRVAARPMFLPKIE